MKGHGKMILTGRLGDVMKESAQAAMSFVRSRAEQLGIPDEVFEKEDIHIHVPSGAIPKDGPSAGVTMMTALTSLLTDSQVDHELAMTGEITLRGTVLPVGGIKEKILAAHRAGIKRVVMPEKCRKDLYEISDDIQTDLEFVFVNQMTEVLQYALGEDILERGKKLEKKRKAAEARRKRAARKKAGAESASAAS